MSTEDERRSVARLFAEEAERTTDSYNRRFGLADNRAAVLIGASALSVGVSDVASAGLWLYISIGLGFIAALLGVFGLLARKSSHLNWINLRDELLVQDEDEALVWLGDKKLNTSARNEPRLAFKNRVLNVGFTSLAISVMFAAAAIAKVTISIGGITIG